MVSDTVKYVNRETNNFTTVPASAYESKKAVACVSDKPNLKISGVDNLGKCLPNLFQVCKDQAHYQITISLRHSGLTGVLKEKLIHFFVI